MKVLVSGGYGLIGSHICELLLERGDEVVVIENFSTGQKTNLAEHKSLTLYEGDIADKDLVEKVFEKHKPEVVVHTAASYKDPDDWHSDSMTNCVGGSNLVKAAKEHESGRFIYFQTALCYGTNPEEQPISLNHTRNPANSSYAITKTTAEYFIEYSGLDYVTFRLANVVGPRNVSGPLPIFYQRLSEGKKCFVTEARRDFVFVKDLVKAVVKAIDGTGSGAYHFSSGKDVAIKSLYDEVVRAMKIQEYPEPEVRALSPDDAPSILLDPTRTFQDFGQMEFTPLSEIVDQAVEYYNKFGASGGYTHLKH
ncbi:MAG: NAD-dependent epimerase/dehydratase family protein [Gammaproteobacteria bacterium]